MNMSVFDKMAHHFAWKEGGLKGYIGQVRAELRWAKQRITRGFSDCDAREFSSWFLSVVPDMLEKLNQNKNGFPCSLMFPKGTPLEGHVASHAMTTEGELYDKWTETLNRMVFLFREANEDTCQRKNPYEDEAMRVMEEFTKQYGLFGEKLMTEEEKAEAEKSGSKTMHFPKELPEYAEIEEKYHEEERKLKEYRKECFKEAMSMLGEWFWDLWD